MLVQALHYEDCPQWQLSSDTVVNVEALQLTKLHHLNGNFGKFKSHGEQKKKSHAHIKNERIIISDISHIAVKEKIILGC